MFWLVYEYEVQVSILYHHFDLQNFIGVLGLFFQVFDILLEVREAVIFICYFFF